ncbi:SMC-Scp complex subunit ScpB [Mesomycoplasma neurolyticum]|uniref:Segregation and condensation protein B n=1 Tax=Mesomycoplasma neurolyticum TaxID=2120 RepID=A0A449A672_9BACT|nr:SMC-Scp complex subunit ScpB [Mesomycoplasma neurolyticum]VEU59717.1 segregation and condensation protein B [Mesomycoplasma neurolyticum]
MKNKVIEAILYLQGEDGLSSEQLKIVLKLNKVDEARILLKRFAENFNKLERGIFVVEFNDVFKFATKEIVKDYISDLVSTTKRQKLTNAAIETAAIVAYKQPVTRSMISEIRGVASDSIVASLLMKGIIEEVGVSPTVGQPTLYGITNRFYDYFRLKSLQDLPSFPEFDNYNENFDSIEEPLEDVFDLFGSQRDENN